MTFSEGTPFALISSKGTLLCVTLHTGILGSHKIHLTKIDPQSGRIVDHPSVPSDSEVPSEESILYAGNSGEFSLIIWRDKTMKNVKIHTIGTKHVINVPVQLENNRQADKVIAHFPRSSNTKPHFLLHFHDSVSHSAAVIHVQKDGRPKRAFDLPISDGSGAYSIGSQEQEVYIIQHKTDGNYLISSADETLLSRWEEISSDGRYPLYAVSEVVHRGAKYSLRSAIVTSSGDWELVRNGESLWTRPESLTGVTAAKFVDYVDRSLLEDLATESLRGVLGAYVHRVKRHLKDLSNLPTWTQQTAELLLSKLSGGQVSLRDSAQLNLGFGFNKILIVATETGRVAAIDAANQGKVIWNNKAVDLLPGQKWAVNSVELDDDSALFRGPKGEFLRIDPAKGTILAHQPGDIIPSFKTSTSVVDKGGRSVVIAVMNDGSLSDVPNADFGRDTVVVTLGEDGFVRGWGLQQSSKPVLLWKFVPDLNGRIVDVTPRPAHDPVASIGKALGDRNVLYKYLNPNILLITAVSELSRTATFYLIDSISGVTLYSTTHTGVDLHQPITSTVTENSFVYSLFAESKSRSTDPVHADQKTVKAFQLIISEMFESPFPNDRGPSGGSVNFSSTDSINPDGDHAFSTPYVLSQSFILPGPITYLTTTSTLQGITPRAILCGVPRLNGIMSIPRHILEPRRPVGRDPTTAETEEGLYRYNPLLDFEPKWMLSHKREIVNISGIIATPSNLESTSLVFAFGDLDLFGTRASPIGSFDMLGKGFSKLQLVGTVVALAVGTGLLAPYVSFPRIFCCCPPFRFDVFRFDLSGADADR